MKSLLLSTFDITGGAARAAFRLHQGLRKINIDSQMLVQYKTSSDRTVIGAQNKPEKWLNQMRPTLDNLPLNLYANDTIGKFSPQWFPDLIQSKIKRLSLDIINIHWACGYLQIETVAKFTQPLVWTLHDMWMFTGGCYYSLDCDRYLKSCGACVQLQSQKQQDLSRWIWQRKAKAWKQMNCTIVTPSIWLADCAKKSSLLQNFRIEVIPNGLDIQRYKPIDRKIAREWLNLPQDKQLLIFGAASTNHPRKGFHYLLSAIESLHKAGYQDKIELVVFGSSPPNEQKNLGFKLHYLGNLNDDITLALVYAAGDIFVAPSVQDNLPNTVMEALSCGTPCVAFNIGGMPDMIEHQQNGYLAQPFEVESFAHGIAWILADSDRLQRLRQRAREKAEQEFSQDLQARRYSHLFSEMLSK
ncbi:glycosyltransferase family 4 protein [Nostoc sp. 106C]|uniref:glycosyltransferase family 4 protein n=1 Tax=Nostoc sp. 106C TaxID=1932667 RepID=UPI000A386997|nr:glycosyltransferase family 4 protein [Nostoc sp. 106C]OUL28824.1 glycosyl transferase [Nostoc sp. 106C]